VPRIPRLRQTLCCKPFGCGRPVWVDDKTFSVDRHLAQLPWPEPGTDQALFDISADLLCQPLTATVPLWQTTLVTAAERAAPVVVVHHVPADGLGGLAVLAALADEWPDTPVVRDFPVRPPSAQELAWDATRAKLRAIRSLPRDLRRGVAGLHELGWTRLRPAEPISLIGPRTAVVWRGPRSRWTGWSLPGTVTEAP
jgi:diacylglycerol O-acyltransferase / wax synthase